MADSLSILAIAGSLRKDSYNKAALRAAQSVCPEGARIEIYDLAGVSEDVLSVEVHVFPTHGTDPLDAIGQLDILLALRAYSRSWDNTQAL